MYGQRYFERYNEKNPLPNWVAGFSILAVREGFEPSIRCRIHTFQACSFSHSDTSPADLLSFWAVPRKRGVLYIRRVPETTSMEDKNR